MFRQISVRRPVAGDPSGAGLSVVDHELVNGLDLPPALVFKVTCGDRQHWITDPVELSRFVSHHPEADVRVCSTDYLRHRISH